MGTRSFPGIERPGRSLDHPPPSSAKNKEKVELYVYSFSLDLRGLLQGEMCASPRHSNRLSCVEKWLLRKHINMLSGRNQKVSQCSCCRARHFTQNKLIFNVTVTIACHDWRHSFALHRFFIMWRCVCLGSTSDYSRPARCYMHVHSAVIWNPRNTAVSTGPTWAEAPSLFPLCKDTFPVYESCYFCDNGRNSHT